MISDKVSYPGSLGYKIAGRVDRPQDHEPRAYAVFAHCFTCSKDTKITKWISQTLAEQGIGVLRFDFTGLSQSEGLFEETNFLTNIQDILKSAEFLKENYAAPTLLIGHSLGGAAALFAAPDIPEVKAVATINAPCDPAHVQHHFEKQIQEICERGEADVLVQGRPFKLQRHFLEALSESKTDFKLSRLKAALLVCHSPLDTIVSIEQAGHIFMQAKHPKSFISLDKMDHLISKQSDADYVARVIYAWASRYI